MVEYVVMCGLAVLAPDSVVSRREVAYGIYVFLKIAQGFDWCFLVSLMNKLKKHGTNTPGVQPG